MDSLWYPQRYSMHVIDNFRVFLITTSDLQQLKTLSDKNVYLLF